MQRQKLITNTSKQQGSRSERSGFFIPGRLTLRGGTTFAGQAPAWQQGEVHVRPGEVVFNTGMSGYVESLTDPSYAGQILIFTYPLIGNYGVSESYAESGKIQVEGVVVSEASAVWSHTKATQSFLDWLQSQNVPILVGVDTRALTKYLRTYGTMAGAINMHTETAAIEIKPRFVTVPKPTVYNPTGRKTVVLVDCGAKENIVRSLVANDMRVKRVPLDYDYVAEDYDGVLISNGPGDPADYVQTIAVAQRALARGKPIFGICLGSQILALAAGARTYKLPFGHRGHNQPCMAVDSERCYITSQNHGYAVDEKSLPNGWSVLFRNLNDNSVEGIAHDTKPFFAVQFHPEACPGPTDTAWLFERFYHAL